jgi:hypothetical protein
MWICRSSPYGEVFLWRVGSRIYYCASYSSKSKTTSSLLQYKLASLTATPGTGRRWTRWYILIAIHSASPKFAAIKSLYSGSAVCESLEVNRGNPPSPVKDYKFKAGLINKGFECLKGKGRWQSRDSHAEVIGRTRR